MRSLAAGPNDPQHRAGIARKQRASRSDRRENRLKHFVKPTFQFHVAKATLPVVLLESLDFVAPRIKSFEVGKDHVSFDASRIAGAQMSGSVNIARTLSRISSGDAESAIAFPSDLLAFRPSTPGRRGVFERSARHSGTTGWPARLARRRTISFVCSIIGS